MHSNSTRIFRNCLNLVFEILGFKDFWADVHFSSSTPCSAPWRKISRGIFRAHWTLLNAVGILTKPISGFELWRFEFSVLGLLWGNLESYVRICFEIFLPHIPCWPYFDVSDFKKKSVIPDSRKSTSKFQKSSFPWFAILLQVHASPMSTAETAADRPHITIKSE